jgi:hypothetical protein
MHDRFLIYYHCEVIIQAQAAMTAAAVAGTTLQTALTAAV